MTWLYVPKTSSASAPEVEGWTSPSSWRFQMLERSAWWRGKPSPSRTWSTRCKPGSWMNALCGLMSRPSAADRGVDLWIGSLAASRASHTAKPGSVADQPTGATCGAQPGALLSSAGRPVSSSKTSRECSLPARTRFPALTGSSMTWQHLATSLRSDYSARQKSASRIGATASSSWPTLAARDHKGSGTATTRADGKLRNDMLDWAAERFWHTPRANDAQKRGAIGNDPRNGIPGQVQHWSTPAVGDVLGGRKARSGARSNEKLLNGQSIDLVSQCHPQAPETLRDGEPSLSGARSLNPLFVEWLMGWPAGWTGFACAETEFTRWRSDMESALASMPLPKRASRQMSFL